MGTSPMNKLLVLIVVLSLMACSKQAVYENIQMHQRFECQREQPPGRYQECMDQVDKSYSEYQRQRERVMEKEDSE